MGEREEELLWIEQSRAGDPAAFDPLVRRYQKMLHSLTYRMTGSLEDAEDLAQEAFIQAYQQLSLFRQEAKFSSWLYRITVNACLNWRQRNQRRQQAHHELESHPELAGNREEQGLSQKIQEVLLKLPLKQRAAIILTTYEGLNHAEAAQALGCSETTVSWRLFAARSKLKRWLKEWAPRNDGRGRA